MSTVRTFQGKAGIAMLSAVLLIPMLPPVSRATHLGDKAPACTPTDMEPGWLKRENALPGDKTWRTNLRKGFNGDGRYIRINVDKVFEERSQVVQGWFDRESVSCGESVGLHLSGNGRNVVVDLYRLGYYKGTGARKILSKEIPNVAPQKNVVSGSDGLVKTEWPISTMIDISPNFPPGQYEARLNDGGKTTFVPLTVRNDVSPDAAILVTSNLTWQAYNHFGGFSLYRGPSQGISDRAKIVSFDRPYDGNGGGQTLIHEYGLIRTIEKAGIDLAYTTDVDLDANPLQLTKHKVVLLGGHSEYWTRSMRYGLLTARNLGVNLINFGADTGNWKTVLRNNRREMVVYRDESDPFKDDPALVTNRWRDPPYAFPESEILGASYAGLGVKDDYVVMKGSAWPFAGMKLDTGFSIKGVVGKEIDTTDLDPHPALQEFLSTVVKVRGEFRRVGMTYYTHNSSAGVINVSTDGWVCGITNSCNWTKVPTQSSKLLAAITLNLVKEATKGPLGKMYPVEPTVAPTDGTK